MSWVDSIRAAFGARSIHPALPAPIEYEVSERSDERTPPTSGAVVTAKRPRNDDFVSDRVDWTTGQVMSAFDKANQGYTRDVINLARSTRLKDSRLSTVCGTRTLVVGSREWVIVPPPGLERDREAIDIAQRVTRAVHAIREFHKLRRTLASGIIYGHAVAEWDWQSRQVGSERIAVPSWTWLHANRFCWVDESIACEELDPKSKPVHLSQYPDKFIVHSPIGGDADYPGRRGVIKTRILPSLVCRYGVRWWQSLLERWGQPQLLVSAKDANVSREQMERMLTDLRRMSSEWRAGVTGNVEVKEIPVTVDGNIHKAFVDWVYTEHSIAVLGQNLTTEVKGGGSYAAARALDNVRADYLMSDLEELDETISDQLIEPLVRFNWPGAPVPYFRTLTQIREPFTTADVDKGICTVDEYRQSRGYDARVEAKTEAATPADSALSQPVPTGNDVAVADTALNGAQIDSLLALVDKYAMGVLPKATVVSLITTAFPTIDAAKAEQILSPIVPSAPATTV